MLEPKKGMLVQMWTTAAYYGVITKVNRVTFDVSHNLWGTTRFDMRNSVPSSNDYLCKSKVHRCTVFDPEKMNQQQFDFLLGAGGVYRGKWWKDVEAYIYNLHKHLER